MRIIGAENRVKRYYMNNTEVFVSYNPCFLVE